MTILDTIKKMLGIDYEYDAFDTDVLVSINTAVMQLRQMGIGPQNEALIVNPFTTWEELTEHRNDMEAIKMYIYIKTKNVFDPNTSSSVQTAMNELAKELEWRLYAQSETSELKSPGN